MTLLLLKVYKLNKLNLNDLYCKKNAPLFYSYCLYTGGKQKLNYINLKIEITTYNFTKNYDYGKICFISTIRS